MKKYVFCIGMWPLGLLFLFFSSSLGITTVDPIDDFRFSLRSVDSFSKSSKLNKFIFNSLVSSSDLYSVLSEETVASYLREKLDLFPQSQTKRLAKHILKQCQIHRFDPATILSLIEVESHFHLKAISPMRAIGLMQLRVPTAQFVIQKKLLHFSGFEPFRGHRFKWNPSVNPSQLTDPFLNTALGIAYLAWLRDYYQGRSSYHVLAAYNLGPTRMNELLARKFFTPVETKKYFLMIRRGVSQLKNPRLKAKG